MYTLCMDIQEKTYNLLKEKIPVEAFGKYFIDNSYQEIRDSLNERKYRVGDTRTSYRVVNHWGKNNLIPEGAKTALKEWREFSFVEMVWLRAVKHLRDFGFSLKRIDIAKKCIIHWNTKTNCYPYFEFCIAQTLGGSDIYIMILADGTAKLIYIEEVEMGKMLGNYSHMLLISLRSILLELGRDISKNDTMLGLFDGEVSVLSEIRKEGNKEVKASIKNRKVKEIEVLKKYPENPSMEEINKQLIENTSFAEVLTKYENGIKQSSEVKIKKRI